MSRKKTVEEFILESKQINGEKYDYSKAIYINNHHKIIIGCPIHGYFEIRPNDHLSKKIGCNKCNNAGISKSKNVSNNIIERFNKKHNHKYDYSLVQYKGFDTKIKIICNIHGIFEQTPHHHLNGSGCSQCSKNKKLTTNEFIIKSQKIYNNNYDYSLVVYKNSNTKVKIICKQHGIFETRPNDHLNKHSGCPICRESKGEYIIRKFLEENNINFIQQKRFKDCKDKKTLPFDFYLYEKNICIEYDGEQHYIDKPTFGGPNRFQEIKRKDEIKNMFCKKYNIHLIRLSYKDDIIEKLKKFVLLKYL